MFSKKQTITAGLKSTNIQVDGDNSTINIGVTFEQYKKDLSEKEEEIRSLLVHSTNSLIERNKLKEALAQIESQRLDEKNSYEEFINSLKQQILRLEINADLKSTELFNRAKEALAQGDYKLADKIFTEIEDDTKSQIIVAAEAAFQRGIIAERKFDFDNAEKHIYRAIQLDNENTDYLIGYAFLNDAYCKHETGLEYFEKVLQVQLDSNNPSASSTLNNIACCLQNMGKYDESIDYLEQSLKLFFEQTAVDQSELTAKYNNLAVAYINKEDVAQAQYFQEKALKLVLRAYGEFSTEYVHSLAVGAEVLFKKKFYNEALASSDRAIKVLERIDNENKVFFGVLLNFKGLCWQCLGLPKKAIHYFERALDSFSMLDDSHSYITGTYNNLGSAWQDTGNYFHAVNCYEKALKNDLQTLGTNHPDVAFDYVNLSTALIENGAVERGVEYLQTGIQILSDTLGEDHPSTIQSYSILENAKRYFLTEEPSTPNNVIAFKPKKQR